MYLIPYDDDVQIGYGFFSLPNEHPFFPAARVHDNHYTDLIAGTSRKTLKQIDREFLRNMLRVAARIALWEDVGEGVRYTRRAWLFYKIVRGWAKTIRADLEAWRPVNED